MTTFAIAALVLIMLPGPDQALITRNALVGGRYGGLLTMLGGVLGLTVHATVDRTEFGLRWNNPLPSGDAALADEVAIVGELQLVKAS